MNFRRNFSLTSLKDIKALNHMKINNQFIKNLKGNENISQANEGAYNNEEKKNFPKLVSQLIFPENQKPPICKKIEMKNLSFKMPLSVIYSKSMNQKYNPISILSEGLKFPITSKYLQFKPSSAQHVLFDGNKQIQTNSHLSNFNQRLHQIPKKISTSKINNRYNSGYEKNFDHLSKTQKPSKLLSKNLNVKGNYCLSYYPICNNAKSLDKQHFINFYPKNFNTIISSNIYQKNACNKIGNKNILSKDYQKNIIKFPPYKMFKSKWPSIKSVAISQEIKFSNLDTCEECLSSIQQ